MRFQLPEGCTGVSHAGVALAVAKDGTVEAAATAIDSLAPHGIVPVAAPAPDAATATGRPSR